MVAYECYSFFFFFSSRRRHTRYWRDWSSDVCSSDVEVGAVSRGLLVEHLEPLVGHRKLLQDLVILLTKSGRLGVQRGEPRLHLRHRRLRKSARRAADACDGSDRGDADGDQPAAPKPAR